MESQPEKHVAIESAETIPANGSNTSDSEIAFESTQSLTPNDSSTSSDEVDTEPVQSTPVDQPFQYNGPRVADSQMFEPPPSLDIDGHRRSMHVEYQTQTQQTYFNYADYYSYPPPQVYHPASMYGLDQYRAAYPYHGTRQNIYHTNFQHSVYPQNVTIDFHIQSQFYGPAAGYAMQPQLQYNMNGDFPNSYTPSNGYTAPIQNQNQYPHGARQNHQLYNNSSPQSHRWQRQRDENHPINYPGQW